jgi:hypothetical protein
MKDPVKIALILAITLVVCVGLYQYFSPYQSCVRNLLTGGSDETAAALQCAKLLGGGGR